MCKGKENKMENSVHFMFASKGGCGKTFAATVLAQYFMKIGLNVKGFDTDQENADFFAYKGIPVRHVNVMDDTTTINQKKFDGFLQALLTEEGTFVVDNGANSFTPLLGYLVENHALDFLKESGKNIFLHGMIGGGDTYSSTVVGFDELAANTDAPVVLWLNEHFGELANAHGTPFVETDDFKRHADKLRGAIMLHKRNPQTFGEDIRRMTKDRLTIEEVMQSDKYSLMEKQRLRTFGKEVFEQLAAVKF